MGTEFRKIRGKYLQKLVGHFAATLLQQLLKSAQNPRWLNCSDKWIRIYNENYLTAIVLPLGGSGQ
jgi:hypothetical protein